MFRFVTPVILIGIALVGFFMFTSPFYEEVSLIKSQVASYNEALANSKALEIERDNLTQKYNSLDPESLSKLEKFLPDNVDNIRLILEIEKIASPYGMVLKDVKYNPISKTDTTGTVTQTAQSASVTKQLNKDYGTWDLEFSTQGSYGNFVNFMRDLENNLRVVDVSSIQFDSSVATAQGASSGVYKYGIKIKTYWLKN
ncbi:hypothetical protein KKA39_00410 [Patescibacteria group bacterium]|nr:hypothetical protein [Patescibacteria group bacterium]MBU1727769.1 hypothetical protein [Patescibacteria group bacterium]